MFAGHPLSHWVYFNLLVLGLLSLDLFVFHRKHEPESFKSALGWSGFWIALALLFNGFIYWTMGSGPAMEFFTGYLIEKSLSVDNLFVFLMVFAYFKTPPVDQRRVLFWGIIGALVLRFIFVIGGSHLLNQFEWLLYVFGAFLIYTGWKMRTEEQPKDLDTNLGIRLAKRIITIKENSQPVFWFVEHRRLYFTPLFLALLTIEFTDVVFALDSVPAIFAVTRDPFIVFTSNVFAILGLRSLFFVLAGMHARFKYLRLALAFILVFVGLKMVTSAWWHLPTWLSLVVIASALFVSIAASLRRPSP